MGNFGLFSRQFLKVPKPDILTSPAPKIILGQGTEQHREQFYSFWAGIHFPIISLSHLLNDYIQHHPIFYGHEQTHDEGKWLHATANDSGMLPGSPLSAPVHRPHLQDQLPLPTFESSVLPTPGPLPLAGNPTSALQTVLTWAPLK